MDVKIDKIKRPLWKKYWYIWTSLVLLFMIFYAKALLGDASYFVESKKIQTAVVEEGPFEVNVRGVGVLKPSIIRWASSEVSGRIEELLVKPGAKVSQGAPLIKLSNQKLHLELEKAEWELKATLAETNATYVNLEAELVALETVALEAHLNYNTIKLQLDAETVLASKGNSTVSGLDFQRTQMQVKREYALWQSNKQRLVKMRENLQANKDAHLAKLGQVQNNYDQIKAQVDALTVKAPISGIVQQLPLELGQKLNEGDNVALVADPNSLMAELQIQELQIRDIILGQMVVVDTRNSQIPGEVIRIDPAVIAGQVQVDVRLDGDMPAEARPDLNIEGLIQVSHLKNATYVKRPAFAQRYTQSSLFVLTDNGSFAEKINVEFGQSSVNHIQLVSGVAKGQQVIVSDTSAWDQHNKILIKE